MPANTSPKKRTAAYVELEHDRGLGRLHCPVCGTCIMNEDEGLSEEFCEHVMLVHDWAGEFQTRDDEVEALVDAAMDEADEKDRTAIELLREKFGQNVVFLKSFQPACGSKDAAAITVVIDMNTAGVQAED